MKDELTTSIQSYQCEMDVEKFVRISMGNHQEDGTSKIRKKAISRYLEISIPDYTEFVCEYRNGII